MNALLLFVGLLGCSALPDDPEPPKPPLTARLLVKKSTYTFGLTGSGAAEYKMAVQQGRGTPPAVDLELVITNNTNSDVRLCASGSLPEMSLTLKGKDVAEGRPRIEKEVNGGLNVYRVLRPGQKLSIPITSLKSYAGTRTTKIHFWAAPGEYTVTATLNTPVNMNWQGKAPRNRVSFANLISQPITLKVEK